MTQEVVEAKPIENTNAFMSIKPNLYIYIPPTRIPHHRP